MIGDGGYITELERRGYACAGPWTPEVNVEHPDAGGYMMDILMHVVDCTSLMQVCHLVASSLFAPSSWTIKSLKFRLDVTN